MPNPNARKSRPQHPRLRRRPWGWMGAALVVLVVVALVIVLVVQRAQREADIPGVQTYTPRRLPGLDKSAKGVPE